MFEVLNNMQWYMLFFIGFLVGTVAGFIFFRQNKHDGIIHVTRGEESDKYLFEFNIPPERIPQMKTVIFKVAIEDDSSQKVQFP